MFGQSRCRGDHQLRLFVMVRPYLIGTEQLTPRGSTKLSRVAVQDVRDVGSGTHSELHVDIL